MATIDSRAFSALALADHKAHGRALHAHVQALSTANRTKPAPLADLAYALRLTLASDLYVSGIPSALHALAHVEILRRHAGRQLADARVLDAELRATGRAGDALDADMRKRIEVLDAQHVDREDAQDARGAYFRAVVALCQLHVFHAYTSADCDTVYQLLPAYFVGKVATRESALTRPWPVLTRLTAVWFVLKSENHNTGSPVVLYMERMMTPLNLSVYYDYIINVVCHSGAWLVYMWM